MLFKETVIIYCENHMKHINTLCGQNAQIYNVKASGTYNYHCASESVQPFHINCFSCTSLSKNTVAWTECGGRQTTRQHTHAAHSSKFPDLPLFSHLPKMQCGLSLVYAVDFLRNITYIKRWLQGNEKALELSLTVRLEAVCSIQRAKKLAQFRWQWQDFGRK
jgi:hypothetical protein